MGTEVAQIESENEKKSIGMSSSANTHTAANRHQSKSIIFIKRRRRRWGNTHVRLMEMSIIDWHDNNFPSYDMHLASFPFHDRDATQTVHRF